MYRICTVVGQIDSIFGLKFFKPVIFVFLCVKLSLMVPNEHVTKKNKNKTGSKKCKPKLNLNNKMCSNLMLNNLFSQRMQSNFVKRGINTRQQVTLKSMLFDISIMLHL